jgi:hypothetical protein
MALNDTLGTGLDATSNPDPNGLTTKAPYSLADSRKNMPFTQSAAWTTQAKKALFPIGVRSGEGDKRIYLQFVPSGGAAVTYTVTMWQYNPVSNTWAKPKNTPSISYTGEQRDYIDNPGDDAIFLQLSSISAGTISIYFDPDNARKG